MRRDWILISVILVLIGSSLSAQTLEGRSRVELRLGMAVTVGADADVSAGGVSTDVSTGGFLGSVGFAYWLSEPWALSFSAGAVSINYDVSVGTFGVNTKTVIISRLLFGARWYFVKSTLTKANRPYLALEAGPIVGSQSGVEIGTTVVTVNRDLTTVGGRLGFGYDFLLSNRWMLGLEGGFTAMADFSEEIAGKKNHSGPDFGVGISYLFGGRK